MVEDLDADNVAEAVAIQEGGGLRKRRGSLGSNKAGQRTIPEDLRELLNCWKPEERT